MKLEEITDSDIEKFITFGLKENYPTIFAKQCRIDGLQNYYKNPNICLYCNNIILVNKNDTASDTRHKKFCSLSCSSKYNGEKKHEENLPTQKRCLNCNKVVTSRNVTGYCLECLKKKREEERISKWLATGETGNNPLSTVRGVFRKYVYQEQNGKCAICGMNDEWCGKKLVFVLDHIDGDASNNKRENLRLVCPNCDSQLSTFKSKNKKSARSFRKKYY